jgi:hypothetical protein
MDFPIFIIQTQADWKLCHWEELIDEITSISGASYNFTPNQRGLTF